MNRLTGGVKILVVQRCQQRLTRTLLNQVLPGLTDRIDELRVGRQIIAEDFLERQQPLYAGIIIAVSARFSASGSRISMVLPASSTPLT
jgi:hypothetical protein